MSSEEWNYNQNGLRIKMIDINKVSVQTEPWDSSCWCVTNTIRQDILIKSKRKCRQFEAAESVWSLHLQVKQVHLWALNTGTHACRNIWATNHFHSERSDFLAAGLKLLHVTADRCPSITAFYSWDHSCQLNRLTHTGAIYSIWTHILLDSECFLRISFIVTIRFIRLPHSVIMNCVMVLQELLLRRNYGSVLRPSAQQHEFSP